MTQSIGIRELKNQLSQVLKEVTEQGHEIDITNHGQVIARLVPVKPAVEAAVSEAAWTHLKDLAKQLGKSWSGDDAASAIDEIRRDL
jgi:prevent-host-death family protein